MTLFAVIKLALVVGVAVWIVADIRHGPPRLLAWAMFTQAAFCRLDLYVSGNAGRSTGQRVDQWRYIPNQDPAMDPERLGHFLEFLAARHCIKPDGVALFICDEQEDIVRIAHGRLTLETSSSTLPPTIRRGDDRC